MTPMLPRSSSQQTVNCVLNKSKGTFRTGLALKLFNVIFTPVLVHLFVSLLELFQPGSKALRAELQDVVDFKEFFGRTGMEFLEIVFFDFADVLVEMIFDIDGVVSRLDVKFVDDVDVGRAGKEVGIG